MTKKYFIPFKKRNEIFGRDGFTCQKCGYKGMSDELEVHHIKLRVTGGDDNEDNLVTLCFICHYFAPDEKEDFEEYLKEKIDGNVLDTFRKSAKSISKRTKKGMSEKSKKGELVSRAPLGYKTVNKQLVPVEGPSQIEEIFQIFLKNKISLTQLGKRYGLSVNGLKKVLTNQTYLGKIKFDKQIYPGTHKPLISSTLFNHVQNKLEKLGIKKI